MRAIAGGRFLVWNAAPIIALQSPCTCKFHSEGVQEVVEFSYDGASRFGGNSVGSEVCYSVGGIGNSVARLSPLNAALLQNPVGGVHVLLVGSPPSYSCLCGS